MSSFALSIDTEFPDQVTGQLQRSNASRQSNTSFNSSGSLLAVGCADGVIAIYDFETKAVAKLLRGHTKPVIACSWSRSSHHLLTASLDGHVIRWNVLAGTQGAYATMPTTVVQDEEEERDRRIKTLHLHPTISDLVILTFGDHIAPLLISLAPLPTPIPSLDSYTLLTEPAPRAPRWQRLISTPFTPFVAPAAATASATAVESTSTPTTAADSAATNDESTGPSFSPPAPLVSSANDDPRTFYTKWHSTVAIFDHSGRFIFEGNSKGSIFSYQLVLPHVDGATLNEEDVTLRLLHIESNRSHGSQKVRVPLSVVHSLVASTCGTYLMCNNSQLLKVYRLEPSLMSSAPEGEELRRVHSEKFVAESLTQRMVENGARISIAHERRLRKHSYKSKIRQSKASKKSKTKVVTLRGPDGFQTKAPRKKRSTKQSATSQDETKEDGESNMNGDQAEGEEQEEGEEEEKEGEKEANEDTEMKAADEANPIAASSASTPTASASGAPTAAVDDEDHEEEDEDDGDRVSPLTALLDYSNTFSDHVNRVPWRRACFSHSSDFILAGSAERGEHRIHIWSIHSGQLTKILLGPTEGLIDLTSHPRRPVLVTCCTSGVIYLWNKNYVENWSAFAPDFEELDDNQESVRGWCCTYVEREDEFDIVPVDVQKGKAREDVFVDICALDPSAIDHSNDLITLPTTVLPDQETLAAYHTRQRLLADAEERRRKEEAAAAETKARATETAMQDTPPVPSTPTSIAGKRPLEAPLSSSSLDDSNKRTKLTL